MTSLLFGWNRNMNIFLSSYCFYNPIVIYCISVVMGCQRHPRACGKTWRWAPTLGRRVCPACVRPTPIWCGWSRPTRWVSAHPATRPYWHSPRRRVSRFTQQAAKDCKLSNLSSAPSGPPVDVTAESSSPDSLQVRWKVGRQFPTWPLLKPIPNSLCKKIHRAIYFTQHGNLFAQFN